MSEVGISTKRCSVLYQVGANYFSSATLSQCISQIPYHNVKQLKFAGLNIQMLQITALTEIFCASNHFSVRIPILELLKWEDKVFRNSKKQQNFFVLERLHCSICGISLHFQPALILILCNEILQVRRNQKISYRFIAIGDFLIP